MDKNALCTGHEFEFQDGDKCQMSLSFIRLKRLGAKRKDLADRYHNVMIKGTKTEFDMLTVLYAAYVCANLDRDDLMSEEAFIEKCGDDHMLVFETFDRLTNPKKRKASDEHSD